MKRIKTMGIAVVMALAVTAFAGAGTASAQNYFESEQSATTTEGSRIGSTHVLDLYGEQYKCNNVSFTGSISGIQVKQFTNSPEMQSCTVNGKAAAWTMNGCKYRFNAGEGPSLVGTVDITGCESPMSMNINGCVIKIGNQNGLGTVEYKKVGSGQFRTITAIANLNSITFTRTGGGLCGGASGTFHNGTYQGEWTVKGKATGSGTQVGIWNESLAPVAKTVFAAEEAPVTVTGASSVSTKRLSAGGVLNCANYNLSGTSATVNSTSLTLVPAFSNCTWAEVAIPDSNITAGGCAYVHYVNGKFDIVGANCAVEPITITRPGCVATIGPQSGLTMNSLVPYTNVGSGRLRTVSMSPGPIFYLTYTLNGPSCVGEGTFSNGFAFSSAKLSATNSTGELQGISVE